MDTNSRQAPGHGRGGRRVGAQNFSPADLTFLVRLLEEEHLFGGNQWTTVSERYNSEYAAQNNRRSRDRDSLRSQWYKMYQTHKPTGDPSCPPHIGWAKALYRVMQDEIGMVDFDDAADDFEESIQVNRGEEHRSASPTNYVEWLEGHFKNPREGMWSVPILLPQHP